MSIRLARYEFEGPYASTISLEDRSGVYAILSPNSSNRYKVIDVGESSEVRSRVENHDRKYCWSFNSNNGQLAYAAYYTPGLHQAGRRAIEQAVRDLYDPPCGER